MGEASNLRRSRFFGLVAGVLLSAAVVGFFTGTRSADVPRGYAEWHPSEAPARPARSYAELRQNPGHANAELYTAAASLLHARLPKLTEPVVRPEGSREQALAARAARRAYDGAPPTIPHPIDQRARPNCLVCHERGAMVGEVIAPAMSHRALSSCTQCHVPAASRESPRGATLATVENEFEPLSFGGPGQRAWTGAPPTMPHATLMRESCDSCHGVSGAPGIRTTHPERQNCQQCHAPSAVRDQRPQSALAETGVLRP